MTTEELQFSVIIPTCRRNDLLARCLQNLRPHSSTLAFEIIVSDDAGDSVQLAPQFPEVKWIMGPGKGPAANRNYGSRHARGQFLVFTDDDCIPDPGWLCAFSAAATEDPHSKVFEGRIVADRPRRNLGEFAPLNETGGLLWSANLAIERNLFESIGGFDERFQHAAMEDVDLRTRFRKLGFEAKFVPAATVCHPWRSRGGWKRCRNHRNSTRLYLTLHPDELKTHGPLFFLRLSVYGVLFEFVPGILRYGVKGASCALIEYLSNIIMALGVIKIRRAESRKL